MTYLHIYTGREAEEQAECLKPVLWHIALRKEECPECKEKIYLEMLEFGYCYWCLSCKVSYHMPVLGFGPEEIWRGEPNYRHTLMFLRREAFHKAESQIDDWGRDNKTGRFVVYPQWRSYAHWSWNRALQEIQEA